MQQQDVYKRQYQYDALMRPIQRRDSWDTGAPVTVRDFTYNRRCELVADRIRLGGSFSYRYDNIGNRKTDVYKRQEY